MSPTETPTKTEEVIFLSSHANLQVVMEPEDPVYDRKGRLDREASEKGHRIEFEGGVYRTSDPKEIEYLRHLTDSRDPMYDERIQEKAKPLEEREPTQAAQLQAISAALVAGDREAIEKVGEVESETHQRTAVLQSVDGALKTLGESS